MSACLAVALMLGLIAQDGPPMPTRDPSEGMDPISQMFLIPTRQIVDSPEARGLTAEWVEFENDFGNTLHGWFLDQPDSDATVLVCNGNTGNMSYGLVFGDMLAKTGFDVMLFDYQGYGWSEGVGNALSLPGDCRSAYDYLANERGISANRIGVLGISLGSVLALALAAERPVAAVGVENCFSPSDQFEGLLNGVESRITRMLAGGLRRALVGPLDPRVTLPKSSAPLLMIHGENDWLLPASATVEFAQLAGAERAEVWFVEDVGHSPETLIAARPELDLQWARFFGTHLRDESVPSHTLQWSVLDAQPQSARVVIKLAASEVGAFQLSFFGQNRFHHERIWIDETGAARAGLTVPFAPEAAFATRRWSADAPTGDGETWQPSWNSVTASHLGWLGFLEQYATFVNNPPPSDREARQRNWEDRGAWLLENLPDPLDVHPQIRPNYVREFVLAALILEHIDLDLGEELALTLLEFYPENPEAYVRLGNAVIVAGFRNLYYGPAAFLAARSIARNGDLDEAREVLRVAARTSPADWITPSDADIDSWQSLEELEALRPREDR